MTAILSSPRTWRGFRSPSGFNRRRSVAGDNHVLGVASVESRPIPPIIATTYVALVNSPPGALSTMPAASIPGTRGNDPVSATPCRKGSSDRLRPNALTCDHRPIGRFKACLQAANHSTDAIDVVFVAKHTRQPPKVSAALRRSRLTDAWPTASHEPSCTGRAAVLKPSGAVHRSTRHRRSSSWRTRRRCARCAATCPSRCNPASRPSPDRSRSDLTCGSMSAGR